MAGFALIPSLDIGLSRDSGVDAHLASVPLALGYSTLTPWT